MKAKKQTLLEKAMSAQRGRPISNDVTREHYELAIAYLNGVVSGKQLASALEIRAENANSRAASIIRHGIRAGVVRLAVFS